MDTPHSETAATRLQALGRKPRSTRRVAVLADAAFAFAALDALAAAGYDVSGLPEDASALRLALAAVEDEAVMLGDYDGFHATLPAALRDVVAARWGAAQRDPFYRPGQVDCGRFLVPALRFGAVAAVAATTGEPTDPPRHHVLARIAWIADAFHADAVIAQRPLGFALAMPVLALTDGPPDFAELPVALDGNAATLHRWRVK